jgi:hypothetical protein
MLLYEGFNTLVHQPVLLQKSIDDSTSTTQQTKIYCIVNMAKVFITQL